MQKNCKFVLRDLKVKLAVGNGALLLFDSSKMRHGTERPELGPAAPSPTPCMGLTLFCNSNVGSPDHHCVHTYCTCTRGCLLRAQVK